MSISNMSYLLLLKWDSQSHNLKPYSSKNNSRLERVGSVFSAVAVRNKNVDVLSSSSAQLTTANNFINALIFQT